MQAALKEGWFSLARARYQMGAGSVGQLQYDQNMSASVRLVDAADAGLSLRSEPAEEPESTLRRRRTPAGESRDGAGAASKCPPQAPLRWFAGSLPPPALRSAQLHFWKALECAVEAANAQRELSRTLVACQAAARAAGEEDEKRTEAVDGESAAQTQQRTETTEEAGTAVDKYNLGWALSL